MARVREMTRSYKVSDYTTAHFVKDYRGWNFAKLVLADGAYLDIEDFEVVSENILKIFKGLSRK